MDRNGLSGSGGKESSDEWRSLFEMSKDSGTRNCLKTCKYWLRLPVILV